jgi:hypothetical protein
VINPHIVYLLRPHINPPLFSPHNYASLTPIMSLSIQDLSLDEPFETYCIVCDRVIVPPKEQETVEAKPKKKAAGAIRVSSTTQPSSEMILTLADQERRWINYYSNSQRDQDDTTWIKARQIVRIPSGHCRHQQQCRCQTRASYTNQDWRVCQISHFRRGTCP